MAADKDAKQLAAAKSLVGAIAENLDLDMWVTFWDGSSVELGKAVSSRREIRIADPGVIASMLRRPSLDTLIQLYIAKRVDFDGGTLVDFGEQFVKPKGGVKFKNLPKLALVKGLTPFLFAPGDAPREVGGFEGEITGKNRKIADNKAFIQFHYDLSNEFYALFLDPEMVYSCAYYTDWANGVEQAQSDKLEMICRKLRLKPGETLLDIGCGWGGLVCHAAQNFGVKAHGITLSEEQLYDKIASIGMYEHIGLKNIPAYMAKVRSLLNDNGVFLNHAISRRAHRPGSSIIPQRMRPEKKAIAKYIFPGGELDDIGHSISAMEIAGFEVHDVEGWREHYARTCKLWCERLTANREQAIKLVGEEKYRIWIAYLAGVSLAFSRGTLRLFQTVATKSAKGKSPLPPTRADLYR
ncbi:MAG: cyclopropane-fatty-acyl-phospholipid synthase family protein [Hyphomonas sp.]|nr:cyclopropane-fatty-acyl-phospholipid synthase family protein [Hyphomonas sp.]